MSRYKLTIEYDGTAYYGWQKQKDLLTIQDSIELAIKSFCGQKVRTVCAGRTDAGVHAVGQVVHFDLEEDFEAFKVMMGLNNYLREQCLERIEKVKKIEQCGQAINHLPIQDIVVLNCEKVDSEFHARFSAKKRFYQYRILNRKRASALRQKQVWHIYEDLDVEKMQKACQCLIGKHDFSSFRDACCQAKSPVKTIDEVKLYKKDDEVIFEISGKSFLHHMVRNIVGTLRMVGSGKISVKEFKEILEAKDRTKAGMTAFAGGLCFMKVEY